MNRGDEKGVGNAVEGTALELPDKLSKKDNLILLRAQYDSSACT